MLGTRIAKLRRQAGWSQTELAKHLGISPSAVGMYEQGRREPAADMLVQLARQFGVTVDYLLTGGAEDPGERTLMDRIAAADARLELRRDRPFSREELAVLLAAMLMEDADLTKGRS